MGKKIASYTDDHIEHVEGLKHIRLKPSMYGCDTHTKSGTYLIVREIIDNSVDEVRMDKSVDHIIRVCFIKKKKGFQVIIKDTGRGVPLKSVETVFTKVGASGKFSGEGYMASSGTYGVGSSVTSGVSKVFAAVSSRHNEGRASLHMVQGDNFTSRISRAHKKDIASGTIIFFEPDTKIMPTTPSEFFEDGNSCDDLKALMEFTSIFVPNVIFQIQYSTTVIDTSLLTGTPDQVYNLLDSHMIDNEIYTSNTITPIEYALKQNGINNRVIWDSGLIKREGLVVPIIKDDKEYENHLSFNVQLFMTTDTGLRSAITCGAVNMIRIDDKTSIHLSTVINSIKNNIEEFVIGEHKEFFINDYKLPIHIISSVDWQHATFVGQSKDRFTDVEFGKGFYKFLQEAFMEMGDEFWLELYNRIAEDIKAKYDRKHKLDLNLTKSDKNLAFELSKVGCFYECKSSDKTLTELIICEGTSAGDSIKQIRDYNTQAVFKLRGKPINALRSTFNEAMKNDIYSDLLRVIGTSPKDTNLEDMRFGKIIILSDSDQDGYHITALLIGILYTINPLILDRGKVIVASPPLYIANIKNNDMFIRDNHGLLDIKAQAYSAILKMELVANGQFDKRYELTGKYLRSFCCLIEHLGNLFNRIGTKLNIDAYILEQLSHCVDELSNRDYDGIAKKLGLTSCKYEVASDAIIMDRGDIDIAIPLSGLENDIKLYLLPELQNINWEQIDFCITTKHTTRYRNELLSIMEIFELFKKIYGAFGINRMKGIGELPDQHMWSTCLDPCTRSYVVIKSIGEVNKMFDMLGVDTAARKELVMQNVI